MPSKKTHRILLLLPLLLAGGLAWGWWYMAAGRFPLAGDLHHDFGTVPIVGRTSSFSHTFRLRNRRSQPVIIETIRSGCGCTRAEASTMTVAPGAPVDIDVTLSLGHAGKKRTSVDLVIADFGPQRLWIQAVGRKETALSSSSSMVLLTSGAPTPLTVMAEIQSSDDEPPAPSVDAPEGIRTSFRGWKAVSARDRKTARAARVGGIIDVEVDEWPQPAGSEPAGSEPAGSEPAGSEPAGSEPAGSEPAGSEPAGSEPAGSEMTIRLGAAPPVKVRVVAREEGPG